MDSYRTPANRMLRIKKSQARRGVDCSVPRSTGQQQVRLSRPKEQELVERRRAGALQRELATDYGINIKTVRAILKRNGAECTAGPSASR